MTKNKLTTAVLVLLFVIILFMTGNILNNKNGLLVKPGLEKESGQQTPAFIPANNPPKEIKYGSSTDLKKELDSINPQVLDSDFSF